MTVAIIEEPKLLSVSTGLIGKIPVNNLWLLMLYASDLFQTAEIGKVKFEHATEIPKSLA